MLKVIIKLIMLSVVAPFNVAKFWPIVFIKEYYMGPYSQHLMFDITCEWAQ